MQIRLNIGIAEQAGRGWQHAGPTIRIGRAPHCELQLGDDVQRIVSWEHARIELKPDGAWLVDNQATNGTFLNSLRVTTSKQLKVGDRIGLGNKGPELRVDAIELGQASSGHQARSEQTGGRQAVAAAQIAVGETSGQPSKWIWGLVAVGCILPLLLALGLFLNLRERPTANAVLPVADSQAAPAPPAIAEVPQPVQVVERPIDRGADETPVEKPSAPTTEMAAPEKLRRDKPAPRTTTPSEQAKSVANAKPESASSPAVLDRHCYQCHGRDGANEGGFNVVTNRDRLVAREYVIPGKADDSPLIERMASGEMPPADADSRPSEDEIAIVRRWIDSGAPDLETSAERREFVTTEQVHQLMADDVESLSERDRRYARYFTIHHLYNAGASRDELQTYTNALSKLANSLSWKRQIVRPQAIDPAGTILRVDLRDYDWSDAVWNDIVAVNPYGVIYDTPAAKRLYEATHSPIPCVRADWFVFRASRPPLYERVLRIPGTDRELEKMLMVDVAQNLRQETARRAGFNSSGVSQNNRLIERHESSYGAYWKSHDFAGNTGAQNLFQHPLGPAQLFPVSKRAQAFQPAGGEIIFSLPNGLQGYMLTAAAGQRIEQGPTQIVSDPKQADRTVVNGISCMSCHYAGVIRKNDEVRNHVLENRDAFAEADDILALYVPRAEMQALMDEDAERFRRAVEQTGSGISENGEPVVNMARRFEEDLDLVQAAAELGLTSEQFAEQIAAWPELRRILGPVFLSGGRLKRQVFTDSFGAVTRNLGLGTYVPLRSR